jgi:hypothetical protein
MDDPADGCAAAWAAHVAAGPRARPEPERLARALLHAAGAGLCRTARRPGDDADAVALAAARASCLLQIALRAGRYDPGAPGEREAWAALLGALPPAWAVVLEDAAAARRHRPAARDAAEVFRLCRPGGAVST